MPNSTAAELLKFVSLQMAAEALFGFKATGNDANLEPKQKFAGDIDAGFLTSGNEHASRFTATQAADFVQQWTVVEHISNTTTGFSGTLFKALKNDPAQNIAIGDLVLSFRSTEF